MSRDQQYEVKTFRMSPNTSKVNVHHVSDPRVDTAGELCLEERQPTLAPGSPGLRTQPTEELLVALPRSNQNARVSALETGEQSMFRSQNHRSQNHRTQEIQEEQLRSLLDEELPVVLGTLLGTPVQQLPRTPEPLPAAQYQTQRPGKKDVVRVERNQAQPTLTNIKTPPPLKKNVIRVERNQAQPTLTNLDTRRVQQSQPAYAEARATAELERNVAFAPQVDSHERQIHARRILELSVSARLALISCSTLVGIGLTYLFLRLIG